MVNFEGSFRHNINLHHIAFAAVAVVTQVAISNGEPLCQVDYSDNLNVSDDEESDVEDGQDGSDGDQEYDDSTAEEDSDNHAYEEEEGFETEIM